MMENQEELNQTIQDLEDCKERILDRHKDNPSLCLRFDSVFKQLVNSLNRNTGNLLDTKSTFEAKPLTKVFGKDIEVKKVDKLNLKPIEVDEVEAFKAKIGLIYESFLDRENENILESLEPIEIRGVAKLAGVANYDKESVDGVFIDAIKKAIVDKNELEAKKQEEKKKLADNKKPENKK